MSRKIKMIWLVITLGLISLLVGCKQGTNQETMETAVFGTGEWMLVDNYDSSNISFGDFLKKKNANSIMEQTYRMLEDTFQEDYYDVATQDIAFLGNYKGKLCCVNGDKESVNQKVEGESITPLKSIQVSNSFYKVKQIDEFLEQGKSFQKKDYEVDTKNIIPVILGSNYKKIFKLGDTFQGNYLGDIDLTYKVIGFLKEKSSIELREETVNLDNDIMVPSLKISKRNKTSFNELLLSIKCEGYIHYSSKKDFKKKIKQLKQIKKTTGFDYAIPSI